MAFDNSVHINETARYTKARWLERRGRREEALAEFRALAGLEGSSSRGTYAYRAFHLANELRQDALAEEMIELCVQLDPQNRHWNIRRGTFFYRIGNFEESVKSYGPVFKSGYDERDAEAIYRYASGLDRCGRAAEATAWLRVVVDLRPDDLEHRNRLLKQVKKTGQAPLVAEVLRSGLQHHPKERAWAHDLHVMLDRTGEITSQLEHGERTVEAYPEDEKAWYALGKAQRKAGQDTAAVKSFDRARELAQSGDFRTYGAGHLYEQEGRYQDAVREYEDELERGNSAHGLIFRIGRALERSYYWEAAAERYKQAVFIQPVPEYLYRLGLVYERLGWLDESAAAYEWAVEVSPKNGYWKFRQGVVLREAGRFEESVAAFAAEYRWGHDGLPNYAAPTSEQGNAELTEPASVPSRRDRMWAEAGASISSLQSGDHSYTVAVACVERGDYSSAIGLFQDAILRTPEHRNRQYAALAIAHALAGDFEASARVFAQSRKLSRPHGVSATKYEKSAWQRLSFEYSEYLDTLPLQDDFVLYESYAGASIGCNPFAVFEELRSRPQWAHIKHFWTVSSETSIPKSLRGLSNVYFLVRGSDAYLKVLATARYLVNNNTFAPYFIRREGQRYLNTWHGTPIKTLGKRIRGGVMDHANAARNLLHATHLAMPNEHTARVLVEDNDVRGSLKAQVAVTGYPRNDVLVGESAEEISRAVRNRLGIAEDEHVVLYAPTWRGSLGDQSFDLARLMSTLEALEGQGARVVFRGHHMMEKHLAGVKSIAAVIPPADLDTANLLTATDVLVTDYSSIAIDFAVRAKPIIYWAYDLAEYAEDRGFCLSLSDLPGQVVEDVSALRSAVKAAVDSPASNVDASYLAAAAEFVGSDDGSSAARVVDWFFEENAADVEHFDATDSRRSCLFFQGSFIPNGITSAFESVLDGLNPEYVRAVTVLQPSAVVSDPARVERFEGSKAKTQVIGRSGDQVASLEERWVIDRLNTQQGLDHERQWDVYRSGFSREFRRMFGDAQFDSVVAFEGYARFWLALLAFGDQDHARRVAYLHNDMMRERQTRFHYLESVFQMYPRFDALISVSKSVGEINQRELVKYGLDEDKLVFINNQISLDKILTKAEEQPDPELLAWMRDADATLINVARLSPEKGQDKLLHAFAEVLKTATGRVRLMIVGEGPLLQQLQKTAHRLGIQQSVRFAGLQENPFPLVKAADGFVFSSEYEGQGLVLLEALVLGLPVVSTDVVGAHSVLEGGEGLLVENTVEGLAGGMLRVLAGDRGNTKFDGSLYNRESREKFSALVMGTSDAVSR